MQNRHQFGDNKETQKKKSFVIFAPNAKPIHFDSSARFVFCGMRLSLITNKIGIWKFSVLSHSRELCQEKVA